MKLSKWQKLWALWLLAFFAIEVPASLNNIPDDTLSEQVWMFLGLKAKPGQRQLIGVWLRRMTAGAFFAWMGLHFFFEVS